METGDEIIIGRMGQQPMLIADATVDPQHALLRKTAQGVYQIEDRDSTKGIFVFGMRIKRKTIKEDTPILLVSVSAMLVSIHQKNIAQAFILERYFFVSICPAAIPDTCLSVFLAAVLLLC